MSDFIDKNLAVISMSRDIAKAAETLSQAEARFLVDYYYICQNDRIRSKNQERTLKESGEPNLVLEWLGNQSTTLEKQVARALDKYTLAHPVGKWVRSLIGFGPVLTAGFLAHIDITKAPAAGHLWSFAGLLANQQNTWGKGQKRPWNADLKKLCFLAGDCAIKTSNHPDSFYGRIFKERREIEWKNNFEGLYHETALRDCEKYDDSTESYAWVAGCYKVEDIQKYRAADQSLAAINIKKIKGEVGSGQPMLPPAQLIARARRYAIKIFLSHLHEVMYENHYKCRVPVPFAIAHMDHVHRIDPPNYVSPYVG